MASPRAGTASGDVAGPRGCTWPNGAALHTPKTTAQRPGAEPGWLRGLGARGSRSARSHGARCQHGHAAAAGASTLHSRGLRRLPGAAGESAQSPGDGQSGVKELALRCQDAHWRERRGTGQARSPAIGRRQKMLRAQSQHQQPHPPCPAQPQRPPQPWGSQPGAAPRLTDPGRLGQSRTPSAGTGRSSADTALGFSAQTSSALAPSACRRTAPAQLQHHIPPPRSVGGPRHCPPSEGSPGERPPSLTMIARAKPRCTGSKQGCPAAPGAAAPRRTLGCLTAAIKPAPRQIPP